MAAKGVGASPPHLPRLKGKTRPSTSAPATSTNTADREEKCRQQATSTASVPKRKASGPPPGTLQVQGRGQVEQLEAWALDTLEGSKVRTRTLDHAARG